MNLRKKLQTWLACMMIFSLLFAARPAAAQGAGAGGPAEDRFGGPRYGVNVILKADQAPLPGGVATLTMTATALMNAPDLTIQWIMPAGVELVGAPSESFGAVSVNQVVSSQRQVRFPASGVFKLASLASLSFGSQAQFGASGVLFFTVQPGGSQVSEQDPNARNAMGSKIPTVATFQPAAAGHGPQAATGCFDITGVVTRIDRNPRASAEEDFYPDERIPVSHAVVYVREEDTLFDDDYAELLTDDNGNFSTSFCDDDGWFDDELEIYVRVRAEIRSGDDTIVEVEDSSWVDEVYEFDSGVRAGESGSFNFNMDLDETQSGIFNIADSIFRAWSFWNESGGDVDGDAIADYPAEVHWERDYWMDSLTGSYNDTYVFGEITINGDSSNPDEWDDSVIIHEWGHGSDDRYSCDDSGAASHAPDELLDDLELAWGEGYPDYWQSAVRFAKGIPDGSWYLDRSGGGTGGLTINLETWDVSNFGDDPANLVSVQSELANAAALWDLNDTSVEDGDNVNLGHTPIQNVYTSDEFVDVAYGFFDDTCDFDTYMRGWVKFGQPANADVAEVVMKNTGYTLDTSALARGPLYAPLGPQTINLPQAAEPTRGIWWDQVTYVVDNSDSMAGTKFEAVKTVINETASDLAAAPQGTEFTLATFNNSSPNAQMTLAGQFAPEKMQAAAAALTTSAPPDATCDVYALKALSQVVSRQLGGDAWLFTDGDTYQSPSVEATKQLLNNRDVRASIALMGLCPALNKSVLEPGSPDAIEQQAQQVMLAGAAKSVLGLAAAETPGGLVPYLLTAINSGGQFLYVDQSQLGSAADILGAQLTNSAGAGRWSDYVSNEATYRFDPLTSWEASQWIDAQADGTLVGEHTDGAYLDVNLPAPFTFYSGGPYDVAHVNEDGYITFGSNLGSDGSNTALPNAAVPNNVLYPYWDQLYPYFTICKQPGAPDCGTEGFLYQHQVGDWFAIEYFQYQSAENMGINTFEVQLNAQTGEIRYLYNTAPNGAANATIGLENAAASNAVQVSLDYGPGASNGMGYKFTPAPPQPAKTYTVTVDGAMDAIGMLLTGYSGTFEPLAITDPDGNTLSCAEAGALCLNLDLVQYAQFNTNGRNGDWHVVVDAGPSGEGTFSFTSMAASPIEVKGTGSHSLPTLGGLLNLDLGLPVDGNILTGWFMTPADQGFGASFSLFDDGAHGDGKAGDGRFGSDNFTPPGAGTGYLWVEGALAGEAFKRIDPVPYAFQPVSVDGPAQAANYGAATDVTFDLHNYDTYNHCYYVTFEVPEGWHVDGLPIPYVCANANSMVQIPVQVYMAAGLTNDLPSGTSGEMAISVSEMEEGIMSDATSVHIRRYRPAAEIRVFNPTRFLRPNGSDQTTLHFFVVDDQGRGVADGTQVDLSATLGTISPLAATTHKGQFSATFTSGNTSGIALITAQINTPAQMPEPSAVITGTTMIPIGEAPGNQISLALSASSLPADSSSTATLTATVLDNFGDPVVGQPVQIGLEGDGKLGAIEGAEVISGTTDINGQFTVVLTAGTTIGQAGVRAELLEDQGGEMLPVQQDRKVIQFTGNQIFLPFVRK